MLVGHTHTHACKPKGMESEPSSSYVSSHDLTVRTYQNHVRTMSEPCSHISLDYSAVVARLTAGKYMVQAAHRVSKMREQIPWQPLIQEGNRRVQGAIPTYILAVSGG